MDELMRSRARQTMHAMEKHTELLVAALDGALIELSPECVRWGAVCDPRRWMTNRCATGASERHKACGEVLALAHQSVEAATVLETLIRAGAAGHDCECKAALRDTVLETAEQLWSALRRWLGEGHAPSLSDADSPLVPQYVPRAVPRAGVDDLFVQTPSRSPSSFGAAADQTRPEAC
jgi:hypothetical protein